MPLERRVHPPVQLYQFPWIKTDKMRPDFSQTGPHAFRVGRQIERPQRTDLAVADETRVDFNANYGAVKDGDGFAP
jgi:hypothetical protein